MSRIELKNISVTFKQNKKEITAVEDVSFSIEAGEIFGIVGLSGAGKSTLVRTINLLQRPSSGQVLIDGVDVTSAKGKQLKEIRKKIGMIFQHFNLIGNKTISQNIEFALKAGGYPADNREKRVNELLELVDLSEKKHSYPANLSGGQKQRVGIARALANNPEILLCDEATSALDVETTEEILRILEKINKELGLTIIFITHEMEVAKRLFNRIAVMENGRVVELGSTYEVFAKPQAAMSKKLVGRYLNLSISAKIMESFSEGVLIEIHYQGDSTLDPLISQISKEYEVFISITHGKIEYINEQPIGILIVYVTGAKSDVKAASEKLQAQVSYTRILNDPIHCLEVDV